MEKPTITQAMIKAYDDYTHLTLDRRGFMEKLTRLAGSGAAAAAIMPMLAANQAQATIIPEGDDRLTTEDIVYPGAGGEMKGYLALPKDATERLPAVIVIHENRGLNAHIRDVTRRMALEGFVALAPDFLSPNGGTPANEDEARSMFQSLDMQAAVANGEATRAFLASHQRTNGKVGAIGFCWGGGMVNRMAVASSDLGAGVAYYGSQVPAEQVPQISAPLMLHYASLDDRINAGIEAFRAALDANNKTYQLYMYDGVNHAFNNDTSAARYDKAAADLAWSRTVEFLKSNLT